MKYEQYSAKDFAADEQFVKWVKNKDQQNDFYWQNWLLEHPEKKAIVEEARQIVQLIQFDDRADTSYRVKVILERINATINSPKHMQVPAKSRFLWSSTSKWQKIAASLIGILLLSTVVFFIYRNESIEYRTAFGEKQEIILPDSSTVILNANSTLRVNKHWGTDREVWLQGEAFFSVQKKRINSQQKADKYSKFIVHTNAIQVNVIGTAFNVSNRRRNTVVVLNSGNIHLSLPDKEETISMKPGDLVEMSGKEQKVTKKVVDPRTYSAWINNEWILDDFTLREVALKIEETYGVKVVINNKDASEKILSGVIPTDNLNVLLEVLSTTLKLKFTKNNNYIMIE